MFLKIRKRHPPLPIIMLTRPRYHRSADDIKRRDIIKSTYDMAIAKGDGSVYFIDGTDLIGEKFAEIAFVDGTHPDDAGFYGMACAIGDKIGEILFE